ncbi:hypothetical protein NQ317_007130 [Molorchus minor]|uniref:3-dehydrosphinganine reductase n=1 Tax=Molorchus minor TaxID=1323400 RepID=A0ABQ9JXJ6_9CUCU|nr:hypothetical protein NQ317_007130 [Molorchus minor]
MIAVKVRRLRLVKLRRDLLRIIQITLKMLILFLIPLVIVAVILKYARKSKKTSLKGRHVVVTGGSSGIGKAVPILAANQGAHVTILARNIDRLIDAQEEIKQYCIDEEQMISKVSVDVANYEDVENNLCELEETVGPIYMLVNCAGQAICGRVEDFTEQQIKTLIDTNFLGTLYPIKAIIPKFKLRKEGIIVLTASQVALMGMYGYSVYSGHIISPLLSLPADTDTPGYELENKTKPEETKLISTVGGLKSPEEVAKKLLDDALNGKFFSYIPTLECFVLTTLCVGMSPFGSLLELLIQVVLLGPLRLVAAFYIMSFDRIVKKCYIKREKPNK